MADWYLKHGDKEYGPMDSNKLKQLAAQNKIRPTDYIRRGADGKWTLASHAKGLFNDSVPNAPTAPTPINVQSGDDNTGSSHPIPPVAPMANPAFTQTPNVPRPVAPPVATAIPVAQKAASSASSSMSFGDGIEFSSSSAPSQSSPKKGKKGKKKGSSSMDKKTVLIASIAGGSVLVLILIVALIFALRGNNADNNAVSENKANVEQNVKEEPKPAEDEDSQNDFAIGEGAPSDENEQSPDAADAQEGQPADSEKIYDSATQSATAGDVEIKIVSIRQGSEPIIKKDGSKEDSPNDATIIEVSVNNFNPEAKVKFTPWSVLMSQGKAKNISLRDKNNPYDYLLKAGDRPQNAEKETQTLFSDREPVKDILIFEHFAPGAKELFLTLPVPGNPNQTVVFSIKTENVGKSTGDAKPKSDKEEDNASKADKEPESPVISESEPAEEFNPENDDEYNEMGGVSEERQKEEEKRLEAELLKDRGF